MKSFLIIILFYFFIFFKLKPSPQNCNLFEPYEWLFDNVRLNIFPSYEDIGLTFGCRFEGSMNTVGFISNNSDSVINVMPESCFSKKVNSVKFLEELENDFAAFLGNNSISNYGSFAQQYNLYGGITANEEVDLSGNVSMGSFVISCEKYFLDKLRLGFYLPYYYFKLSCLNININNEKFLFEQSIEPNILNNFLSYNPNVAPYTLTGFGDSSLLLSWQNNFFEKRDFLTGILCSLRGGINIPGQKKEESEETLLKIPLGYDAAWGLVFGGTVEIDIGCYFGAGVSADCIKFFGRTVNRYIKSDVRQTSLLLLSNSLSYISPGFKEQFTIFLTSHNFNKDILGTFAYQYNKQNDSDIIVCSEIYPNNIAMTSQRLGAWTNHNLVFMIQGILPINCYTTTGSVFAKIGFNGERTIAANTLGLQFEILF